MSFFTNIRADRFITELKTATDVAAPTTQKAIAKLRELGAGAIEPVTAALADADKIATVAYIEVLTGLEDGPAPTLTLRIPEVRLGPRELDQLREIFAAHAGSSPVVLDLGSEKVRLTDEFRVDVDRVVPEIRMSFGHDAIVL